MKLVLPATILLIWTAIALTIPAFGQTTSPTHGDTASESSNFDGKIDQGKTTAGATEVTASIVAVDGLTFAEGKAAKFSIAVNGRSHQQTPITTYRGWQYVTFFDAQRRVCLGRRKLPTGPWELIRFNDHTIDSNDSHNTTVLGICHRDGTIHLAFDHHATRLNYRVSKIGVANNPESTAFTADLFGTIQHTLGSVALDPRVTYPRFFNSPDGNLMLFYRAGTSADGDGSIHRYDGQDHRWLPGLGNVISKDIGTFTANGKTSLSRCPYMNDLCYGGDRLHASWVWRDRFKRTLRSNQHDLCYAFSDDDGQTWCQSNGVIIGQTGTKLIHLNTPGLVVAPVAIESGLTNQNTQFAYPDHSVHIVTQYRSSQHCSQRYQHHWRTADGTWRHQALPFSGKRPKLLGNDDRTLLLVFNDEHQPLSIAKGVPNSDRTQWTWTQLNFTGQLPIISGEPLVDYPRWKQEKILSIYCQKEPAAIIETDSPSPVDGLPAALVVLDIDFR